LLPLALAGGGDDDVQRWGHAGSHAAARRCDVTAILSGWRLLGCAGAADRRRPLPPTPPWRGPDLGRRAAVRRRLRADADVGAPALRTCSGKPAARGSGGAAGVGA